MKPKKLVKRLSLGKTTIANLGDTEQLAVKGGYWVTEFMAGCYTWHAECPSKPVEICPQTWLAPDCTNFETEEVCVTPAC